MDADIVSWHRVEELAKILCGKITTLPVKFETISTISRGGLIPARLIADILGLNEILVDKKTIPETSLFVDDIFDSGHTFKKIVTKAENPKSLVYATLFARKRKIYPKKLLFATKTQGNEYVVFPWEKFEHQRLIRSM